MVVASFFFVLTMVVMLMVLKPFEQTSISNVFDGYVEMEVNADRANEIVAK